MSLKGWVGSKEYFKKGKDKEVQLCRDHSKESIHFSIGMGDDISLLIMSFPMISKFVYP